MSPQFGIPQFGMPQVQPNGMINPALGLNNNPLANTGANPFGFGATMQGVGAPSQMGLAGNNMLGPMVGGAVGAGYRSTVDILQDPNISPEAKSQIVSERYRDTIQQGAAGNPEVQRLMQRAQTAHFEVKMAENQKAYQEKSAQLQQLRQEAAQARQPQQPESEDSGGGLLGGLMAQVKENPEMLTGLLSSLGGSSSSDDEDA